MDAPKSPSSKKQPNTIQYIQNQGTGGLFGSKWAVRSNPMNPTGYGPVDSYPQQRVFSREPGRKDLLDNDTNQQVYGTYKGYFPPAKYSYFESV